MRQRRWRAASRPGRIDPEPGWVGPTRRGTSASSSSIRGEGHGRDRHPQAELEERRAGLRERVRSEGQSGYVLFGQDYIRYFTSFVFLSNERLVVYAESACGEDVVFGPSSRSSDRAETVERVESYPVPGFEHPMLIFARVLADLGLRGPIGADGHGYPGILGYEGPSLSEVTSARVEPLRGDREHDAIRYRRPSPRRGGAKNDDCCVARPQDRVLSEPFHVAQVFTGTPGVFVSLRIRSRPSRASSPASTTSCRSPPSTWSAPSTRRSPRPRRWRPRPNLWPSSPSA